MNEPLKSGDRCLVVDGFAGRKSASIGREVIVVCFSGDHSRFGRMWRCRSADGKSLTRIEGNNLPLVVFKDSTCADFAQPWLQKLPPEGTTSDARNAEIKETA